MSNSTNSDQRESEVSALRETMLAIHEQCLHAQLLAVRKLQSSSPPQTQGVLRRPQKTGRSQVDLTEDILKAAGQPLHLSEIIARIAAASGRVIDPESLGSALSKRVARKDRFCRSARNTFTLL